MVTVKPNYDKLCEQLHKSVSSSGNPFFYSDARQKRKKKKSILFPCNERIFKSAICFWHFIFVQVFSFYYILNKCSEHDFTVLRENHQTKSETSNCLEMNSKKVSTADKSCATADKTHRTFIFFFFTMARLRHGAPLKTALSFDAPPESPLCIIPGWGARPISLQVEVELSAVSSLDPEEFSPCLVGKHKSPDFADNGLRAAGEEQQPLSVHAEPPPPPTSTSNTVKKKKNPQWWQPEPRLMEGADIPVRVH